MSTTMSSEDEVNGRWLESYASDVGNQLQRQRCSVLLHNVRGFYGLVRDSRDLSGDAVWLAVTGL